MGLALASICEGGVSDVQFLMLGNGTKCSMFTTFAMFTMVITFAMFAMYTILAMFELLNVYIFYKEGMVPFCISLASASIHHGGINDVHFLMFGNDAQCPLLMQLNKVLI